MLIVDMSFRTKEAVLKLNADDYTTPLPSFANMNISSPPELFMFAYEPHKGDYSIMLPNVTRNGLILEIASPELKKNPELVKAAMQENVHALHYADKELKADRDFMLEAVQENVDALWYADEALKADGDFMRKAVQENVDALKYAAAKLRSDRIYMLHTEGILTAENEFYPLQYATDELRSDRDFMLACIEETPHAFQYATDALKSDSAFKIQAVMVDPCVLIVDKALTTDRGVVLAAVKQNGEALQDAEEGPRADPAIVLAAVRQNGRALEFAAEDLRADPEIMKAALHSILSDTMQSW